MFSTFSIQSINAAGGMQTNLINTTVCCWCSKANVMKERKERKGSIHMEEDSTLHASCWQSESGDTVMKNHHQVIINPAKR